MLGVLHILFSNNELKKCFLGFEDTFISRSYQQLWRQITDLHLRSYKNASNCSCFVGGVKLVAGDNVM